MAFNIADPSLLGTIYVQETDDGPPALTLFVRSSPRLELVDHSGVSVSPKSPRLGFNGPAAKAGRDNRFALVCDDDVTSATRDALTAAGYARVVTRG